MIKEVDFIIKEALLVAKETCVNRKIRPFDLILAESPTKYVSNISKLLHREKCNIAGVIINKHIFGKTVNNTILRDKIIGDTLYVWYTIPSDDSCANLSTTMLPLDVFKSMYDNVTTFKMKKNIIDCSHVINIRKKMDKIVNMVYPPLTSEKGLISMIKSKIYSKNADIDEIIDVVLHAFKLSHISSYEMVSYGASKYNDISILYENYNDI